VTRHLSFLEIPPRNDHLARARQFVADAARGTPLGPHRLANLQLAVSEACANAINAQVASGVDDDIAIRCAVSGERIEVTVIDRGGGFDPDGVPGLPPPDDPRRLEFENGLGLPLMHAFADALQIGPAPGGTAVRLVMLAPLGGGPPAACCTRSSRFA
jgi:serine/threonine-protein kinase RsbW